MLPMVVNETGGEDEKEGIKRLPDLGDVGHQGLIIVRRRCTGFVGRDGCQWGQCIARPIYSEVSGADAGGAGS